MKGQSLVIQFVMFFVIGFTLFLTIGNFFRYQSDRSADEIVSDSLRLTNTYISSASISIIDSCKQCDQVAYTIILSNTTAGTFFEISLQDNSGLKVSTQKNSFLSSIHLLSKTTTLSGSTATNRPLILTYDKNNNQLRVV